MNISALLTGAIEEMLERVRPFLTLVRQKRRGAGAGVLVGNGLVLTNLHVVGRPQTAEVELDDRTSYEGQLVASDPRVDLALLRIPANGHIGATLSNETPRLGELVYAFGHPWGQRDVLTGGVLSAVTRLHAWDGEVPVLTDRSATCPREFRRTTVERSRRSDWTERPDFWRRSERGNPSQSDPEISSHGSKGKYSGGCILMRVAIVASSLALRIGLRELLCDMSDVDLVADSTTPQDLPAADVWVINSPDYLLDLQDDRQPPPLLLTDDPDQAARLAGLPVWAALTLDASAEAISAALHALAEGLWVGSPALIQILQDRQYLPVLEQGQPAEQVADELTGREHQVLQLAAQGLANKQIAGSLEISENTVKFHLSSLYAKLGVTSRTEAVRAGVRRGWVVL